MPEDPFEPARQTSTAVLEREETVTQPVEPGDHERVSHYVLLLTPKERHLLH